MQKQSARSLCLLVALVAVLALFYLPALPDRLFTIDDPALTQTPVLQRPLSLQTFETIFTPATHIDYYPVRDLSYLIDAHVFGNEPLAYRVHQFVLLFMLLFFTYGLLGELEVEPSVRLVALALWTANAAHAEMLIWISSRKDLLALVFGVAAVWALIRAIRIGKNSLYMLAVVLFLLSLLSKASLSLLPFAGLVALYWGFKGWRKKKVVYTLGALITLSICSSLLQSWFYSKVVDMRLMYPWDYRIQASAAAFAKTTLGWILPSLNTIDVQNWGHWVEQNQAMVVPGLMLWLAVIAALIVSWWRRARALCLTVLCFGLLYLPVSALIFPHKSFYSIRYMEPPFFVLLIASVVLIFRAVAERPKLKSAVYAVSMILIVAELTGSWIEAANWEDPRAIFHKATAANPESVSLLIADLKDLRNWMRMKDPSSASLAEEVALEGELNTKCSDDKIAAYDPSHSYCWEFYLMQSLLPEVAGRGPRNDEAYRRFLNEVALSRYPHRGMDLGKFKHALQSGEIDRALFQNWREAHRDFPTPEYRFYNWVATCLLDGEQSAKALMSDYDRRLLVEMRDVVLHVRAQPSAVIAQQLHACLPSATTANP